MAKSEVRIRAVPAGQGGKGGAAAAEERFPPLSTSLAAFLRDGSDREFRRLLYSLLGFWDLMERARVYFADYIGVTGPQYSMIAVIAEAGRTTVSQVAQQIGLSGPFVTAEMGKLVRQGIVEKRPHDIDRRSAYLLLTERGKRLLRELGPYRRMANDMMYRSLDNERGRLFAEIVDQLIRDYENTLHELDSPRWRGQKAPSAGGSVSEGRR